MASKKIILNESTEMKKKKVAWGITGGGDKIHEIIEVMKQIKNKYEKKVDVNVYLSKAGDQVLKWYRLADILKENFTQILVSGQKIQ